MKFSSHAMKKRLTAGALSVAALSALALVAPSTASATAPLDCESGGARSSCQFLDSYTTLTWTVNGAHQGGFDNKPNAYGSCYVGRNYTVHVDYMVGSTPHSFEAWYPCHAMWP